MIFLAVDPGLKGAFAQYDDESGGLSVADMPTMPQKFNHTMRRVIDRTGVLRLMQNLNPDFLIIEQVGGLPGQSAAGAFSFGHGAGLILGMALYKGLESLLVHPSVWKRTMGVTKDKNQARARASELFPEHAHLWERKKDDGRAEAAILAMYASDRAKDIRKRKAA